MLLQTANEFKACIEDLERQLAVVKKHRDYAIGRGEKYFHEAVRLREALEKARKWKTACQNMVSKRKGWFEEGKDNFEVMDAAEELEMKLRKKTVRGN